MSVKQTLTSAGRAATGLTLLSVERLRTGAMYSPFGTEYWSNPYPMYSSLRSRDPCHVSLLTKSWVLTRHDDITAVLRDGRCIVDSRKLSGDANEAAAEAGSLQDGAQSAPTMLSLDPPDHTRLRALVSKAFTQRSVEALRPRIETLVHQCLDAVAQDGEMDAITALAHPLPAIVIAEMLGVPAEDHRQFKRWADDGMRAVGYGEPEDLRRSREAIHQMRSYLAGIVEERRRDPKDDLLSALLEAEQQGDKLTSQEVLSTCSLLLNAGHANTTNLIGNGLVALLQHPEQLEALRQDPSLMAGAVEEALRYDSPLQGTARLVLEDVTIRGRTINAGRQVTLLLGAANRDPEQFDQPDSFDIGRSDNPHLAFGYGIHHCLGAPLARLEVQIALAAIIERFPKLRLATGQLDWQQHMLVRGLKALPLTF